MEEFAKRADLSWMRDLHADPEADKHGDNRKSRQVRSGHWVPVKPKALPKPRLVIYSPVMATELGLSDDTCNSEEFLRFFSGDIDAVPGFNSWATPYALAIMGNARDDNCPFKNGNGYGDGRAVSVGEVISPTGQRWEMQLKGGGQTPFCRGADGRAVLRSSVREFLASEAMHHLGISTTRAISLIVSQEETTQRPWYSGRDSEMPGLDDPRIQSAPPQMREMLIQMLKQQSGEPDVMIREACAITCRVAPSFIRIGHLDLFARRASKVGASDLQKEEHQMIVQHAFNREYPDILPDAPLPERALAVFEAAAERLAKMVAGWVRVGFCQGNFNCDNCLLAGRQMDYGPFGFIDQFDPLFAKWVGSGEHFAFINQPGAAYANLTTLETALSPLFKDSAGKQALKAKLPVAKRIISDTVDTMFCKKLGFEASSSAIESLTSALLKLMELSGADYTILYRQLAELPASAGADPDGTDDSELLAPLRVAFYKALTPDAEAKWVEWLRRWLKQLASEGKLEDAGKRMNECNPKYILREYMLVKAYEDAKNGDYANVHELYQLIRAPYDEQPEFEAKYYKRAPDAALSTSGTSVMT